MVAIRFKCLSWIRKVLQKKITKKISCKIAFVCSFKESIPEFIYSLPFLSFNEIRSSLIFSGASGVSILICLIIFKKYFQLISQNTYKKYLVNTMAIQNQKKKRKKKAAIVLNWMKNTFFLDALVVIFERFDFLNIIIQSGSFNNPSTIRSFVLKEIEEQKKTNN